MRYIIVTILLLPILTQAQTFKHSFFAGPNFSFYTSKDSEIHAPSSILPSKCWNIGTFGGYILEYNFPKTIILGTSIQYLNINAKFNTPCYCFHPHDRTVNIGNTVSTHNIGIPLYFKLKTNKINYTYFTGGFGINWLFSAHRKVENAVNFLHQKEPIITEIANESFTLKNSSNNQLGTFFQIGIGQKFQVKRINFFTELSYRQDINSWLYKTVETPDGIKEFPIKRQSINLKIGIFLKNKTNDDRL